jgi:kumamolisin
VATNRRRAKSLLGSGRPRPEYHNHIGPADPEQVIGITIIVRHRPGSPPLPDLEYWYRTPLRERRAMSRDEYARVYGADENDLAAVNAFAAGHRLRVIESHAGRRSVTVEGTIAQLEAAFGITLNRYQAPPLSAHMRSRQASQQETGDPSSPENEIYHGYEGPLALPEELAEVVEAVVGLDNRTRGRRAGCADAGSGDPPGANGTGLFVPQVAYRYNLPNSGAPDQTIGVHAPGGAYLASDIQDVYFPNLKSQGYPDYATPPTINDVNLTVGSVTYQNSPSLVQAQTASSLNAAVGELTVDISICATVAQGATVNVYFTSGDEQGWIAFLDRVLVPETEQAPTVITSSWAFDVDDSGANIGFVANPASPAGQMHARFRALAAVGVNIFYAQGDFGADNWWTLSNGNIAPDGNSHVGYPGTDPWVTSCGGTIAGTEEVVWSDSYGRGLFGDANSNFGATGGGVSAQFRTAPPYQTAIGVTGATDSTGKVRTGRGVPDVAGHVVLTGFVTNGSLFYPGPFVGTSAVAPLYAGLAAVLRSALGREFGPFNEALYSLKDVAFTDITSGNNSSYDTPANVAKAIHGYTGNTANAPYFTAGPGWDACSGLGRIDGNRLLNGIAAQLHTPNYYFAAQRVSFRFDEVKLNPTYSELLSLILEGYTPDQVTGASVTPTMKASDPRVTVSVGTPTPQTKVLSSAPERVAFSCTVTFASPVATVSNGGLFPDPGDPPAHVTLTSDVTLGSGPSLLATVDLQLF